MIRKLKNRYLELVVRDGYNTSEAIRIIAIPYLAVPTIISGVCIVRAVLTKIGEIVATRR